MTSEIPHVYGISTLTYNQIKEWYHGLIGKDPVDLAHQSNDTITKHKHTLNSKDPPAGVQPYVHSIMSDLRRIGGA